MSRRTNVPKPPAAPVELPTREDLIELCVRGVVPVERWHDRDSAGAQEKLGKAWALLSAGCDWEFSTDPTSTPDTWWIEITWPGFATVDWGGEHEEELFYLPTAKRLDKSAGRDWY